MIRNYKSLCKMASKVVEQWYGNKMNLYNTYFHGVDKNILDIFDIMSKILHYRQWQLGICFFSSPKLLCFISSKLNIAFPTCTMKILGRKALNFFKIWHILSALGEGFHLAMLWVKWKCLFEKDLKIAPELLVRANFASKYFLWHILYLIWQRLVLAWHFRRK